MGFGVHCVCYSVPCNSTGLRSDNAPTDREEGEGEGEGRGAQSVYATHRLLLLLETLCRDFRQRHEGVIVLCIAASNHGIYIITRNTPGKVVSSAPCRLLYMQEQEAGKETAWRREGSAHLPCQSRPS